MELKVNDYVRTKLGISKLIDINIIINEKEYQFDKPVSTYSSMFEFDYRYELDEEELKDNIIKSSPNIIDLIEVGDYVNGSKVVDIAHAPTKTIYTEQKEACALIPITKDKLKSILTKEQFKSMEYKL